MEALVGTSGWYYSWNEGGNLDWYLEHSGLNAVELNASFYRFPFPNQVLSWARKGKNLRWSVKVHRSVTHSHRFSEGALGVWERFRNLFTPLDPFVDFYLFQAPPGFRNTERVLHFAERAGLGERFALEIRNRDLLGDDDACGILREKVLLVSVDSPDFFARIFPGCVIYLRLHGRTGWYSHDYSREELQELAELMKSYHPARICAFFNNDSNMLGNAQTMREVLG
jgi:uncharacterized protein YecE (DUF72 family)